MSAGLEMEQMLDTKGRRHIYSPKLGSSLGNCPSVIFFFSCVCMSIITLFKVLSQCFYMWLGLVEM